MYENEKSLGEAINSFGLLREEVFITTKLLNNDQGYENTIVTSEYAHSGDNSLKFNIPVGTHDGFVGTRILDSLLRLSLSDSP